MNKTGLHNNGTPTAEIHRLLQAEHPDWLNYCHTKRHRLTVRWQVAHGERRCDCGRVATHMEGNDPVCSFCEVGKLIGLIGNDACKAKVRGNRCVDTNAGAYFGCYSVCGQKPRRMAGLMEAAL